jgi:hypothetical protein
MPHRQGVTIMKFRTAALGIATAAALALPASAMADTSLLDSLSRPATIDGHKYSAQQMKHRFAGQNLFFVLGSKEEGAGAVAAFHSKGAAKAYVGATGRAPKKGVARAAYNGYQTVFYSDAFLEGAAIAANSNSGIGDLSTQCMKGWVFGCFTSWDNQISSAKTGYTGAYLYNRPWNVTSDGYIYIPGQDSVEVWRYFNDVTSSVWVP